MESWRLITTWEAPAQFNMGLDEAFLHERSERPVLRIYSWGPPTLSLGYFQKFEEVPAAQTTRSVVRRITGGGAIHHDHELTFSISAPATHRIYRGPIAHSYERVHGAIQDALRKLGVESALRGEGSLDSDQEGTGMCFHHSTSLDLVWSKRKGVGSAQRRKNGHVLHHGSIKLGSTELEGDIATVRSVCPDLRPEKLASEFLGALSDAFELEFEHSVPDSNERTLAEELGTRYTDPDFLRRR